MLDYLTQLTINIIRSNLLETNSSVNEKNYVMQYFLFGEILQIPLWNYLIIWGKETS